MIPLIEPVLYTDPQAQIPRWFCERCGGECYETGPLCPRCGGEPS